MNYEELLASRNGAAMMKDEMPFGFLYKKQQDSGYVNVLDLRHELLENTRFCEKLKAEAKAVAKLTDRHQLHFQVTDDSSGSINVVVERSNCRTFERYIEDTPSIVASKQFVERVMKSLVEAVTYLNEQGIYHLCFAPSNILVRKGDDTPLLLFHGSSYLSLKDQKTLYGNGADYVAPEILGKSTADPRSEVFSLGLFMKYLYNASVIPYEYRAVIKKATQSDPDQRYATPNDMLKAMTTRHSMRSTLITGVIAAAIALLGIGLYLELVPGPDQVEFVESAPHEDFGEEMFPENLAPSTDSSTGLNELADSVAGVASGASDAGNTDEEALVNEKQMKVYNAKAEQIFRKRYAAEAEVILSKIYNNEHMNGAEKKFLLESSSITEELARKQMELGQQAGLSDMRSQRIASEIIERITNEKKKQMGNPEKEGEE